MLIPWYRAVGVSRSGFCHMPLARWRKMQSPRPLLEVGGLVGPEALVIWSNLRASYFPGCACGISCASQHRFRIWSGPLWPGSGISRTCLTAWLPPFSFGVSSSGLPGVQDVAAGGVRRPVGWGIHLFRCPVVAGVGRYVWRVADRRRSGGFVQVGWGSDYFLTAWPRHGGFWRKSKVWRGASCT